MAYRLKINGIQYSSEIEGAGDWTRSVVRDFNDRLFRTRGEYRFKGHKGLYNLLYNHLSTGGVCEALKARIYFNGGDGWDYEWKGEIKPQDIEYDLLKRSADGQVLDDSWAAKFNNSQQQKIFLRSISSKNGEYIPSCANTLCLFFDPTDGTLGNYLPDTRLCFRIYEVFKFLVSYYSDNTVTFASDYFDTGDGYQYWLTNGQEIRQHTNWLNPEVSFDEVFTEMNKKCNLWIIIEGTPDAPILRIEDWGYVFKNQKILEVRDPEGITLKTDLDQLYTVINVGSDAKDYDLDDDADYPEIFFRGWQREGYNSTGDCQFENNTLDLVSGWKIDNNSIQYQLNTADDPADYDDDLFLIEIDGSPDYDAIKFTTDYTGAGSVEYIYNFNLTNEQVIIHWFNGIPQLIQKDISKIYYALVDSLQFKKVKIANSTSEPDGNSYADVVWTNDSVPPAIDIDDLYTTPAEDATHEGEFEAQIGAYYRFYASVTVGNPKVNKFIGLSAHHYTDNTRARRIGKNIIPASWVSGNTTINASWNLFMSPGEVVVIRTWEVTPIPVSNTGYDQISGYATITSVNIQYSDPPTDPMIYIYDLERFNLSDADFATIDQGRGFVRIIDTNGNKAYDVWCKDVQFNRNTGVGQGEFIGSGIPTELCWALYDGFWHDECYWFDNEFIIISDYYPFIITVDTTKAGVSANDEFQIPTQGSGYNYFVTWGDGNQDTGVTGTKTHTYAAPGTYTVKIHGDFPRIYFNNTDDKLKCMSIEQWGEIQWTNFTNAFYGCSNVLGNFTDSPDLASATSVNKMFSDCSLFDANLGNWNTSTITDFSDMLVSCAVFNNGGSTTINNWDVSSGLLMFRMFGSCYSFNQPLGSWNVSSVTDMSRMFQGTTNTDKMLFNQDLSAWDTGNVTTMASMFRGNTSGSYLGTSIHQFNNGGSAAIENWDVSSCQDFNSMFMVGLFNQPLDGWNMAAALDISSMFYNGRSFNQPLNSWNTAAVTNMQWVFFNARIFNQDLSAWDTGAVTNMSNMFNTALLFNQNIGAWDVSLLASANNFMANITLSTANYNALLIGWTGWAGGVPTKTVLANVFFSVATTQYSLGGDAEDAHTYLDVTKSWTITDGGGV